jgi:cytochrome oxidase Cu insertion factor (SCO1/SenC/PrrC family)
MEFPRHHSTFALRRRLRVAAALVAALCTGALLAACGSSSGSSRPVPSNGTTLDLTVPTSIEDLPLRDENGRPVTLSSLHGKTVVLSPSLTLCQEICPLISANFGVADRDVRAAGLTSSVEFVEVTVDPQRDDQTHLKAYQGLYGEQPNWEFLGGTPAQIAAFWNAFHLSYGRVAEDPGPPPRDWLTGAPLTYDVDHENVVYVLRPNGHIAWLVDSTPWVNGAQIPPKLEKFLSETGRHNQTSVAQTSWDVPDVLQAIRYVTGKQISTNRSG